MCQHQTFVTGGSPEACTLGSIWAARGHLIWKDMFYIKTHSTHFIYSYIALNIW